MLKFINRLLPWLYGAAIVFAVYVVFFMPAGTGQKPVDSNNPSSNVGEGGPTGFNLYSYLNGIKSARGKIVFDCDFKMENGDEISVKSTQQFESKGTDTAMTGSTAYALNGDTAIFDDATYIRDKVRYIKAPTGYLSSENIQMDAGNLNFGRIEESLDSNGKVVLEDGISCYKYTGSMVYGDMSNSFREYIRAQNINVSDIKNLTLNFTIFVTEQYVPYKMIISFEEAKCMIKSTHLAAKNGTATGSLTLTFGGFNGVETLNYPSELNAASAGSYVFTDKLNRYLEATGHN